MAKPTGFDPYDPDHSALAVVQPELGAWIGDAAHRAVITWTTKAEAAKAAKVIGWPADRVQRCHARFATRLYGLRHPMGGLITHEGFTAALRDRSSRHETRTHQRKVGERYVTKSNGSRGRYKPEFVTTWGCSCGAGGFGHDRTDARVRARSHREDPTRFPGVPDFKPAIPPLRRPLLTDGCY